MEQRLYVGSVNYTLTDNDLRQVFEPYGPIDFVDLHRGTYFLYMTIVI